eukprot:scaffold8499_cov75-Skeletonema_marinoi.AAC.1
MDATLSQNIVRLAASGGFGARRAPSKTLVITCSSCVRILPHIFRPPHSPHHCNHPTHPRASLERLITTCFGSAASYHHLCAHNSQSNNKE